MGNLPICSQDIGTLKTYQYKSNTFQLHDGHFLFNELKLKLPRRSKISTFERVILSLGLPLKLDDIGQEFDIEKNINTFRDLLHTLTLLALKDLNIVNNGFSYHKQHAYGKNVFEAYLKSVTGSGRIKAVQKNIRWLSEQDTLQLKEKLFTTTGYQVDSHSIKYTPTNYAENIIKTVFQLLKSIDFVHNDITIKPLDFIVTIDNLSDIRLRDTMLLLSECIGYHNGFVIRPNLKDTQYSRVYSIFTSINSFTRKILGYYNYDIGAALQTICMQLVEDSSLYPLHIELVNDKKAFRAQVQNETGKDILWVKKELSKINNKETMPKIYNQYPTLKLYYDEAQLLRKEIIDTAEPIILSRARDFAKIKHKKIWIKGQKKPQLMKDGKKESSIFFFIWTQWERQIRESMMSCFDDPTSCHQVHDAVYSKQKICPNVIESKVLENTGFDIHISIE